MLRTLKSYHFKFNDESTSSHTMIFTTYPATLTSVDDYFVMSSGLSVIETTNGIMNDTLYQYVTQSSVLSWIRTIVANRMAKSGQHWIEIFSKYNSGTYNNQWMILDTNKFTPGQPLQKGGFWIAEQIPGYIERYIPFSCFSEYLQL